MSKRSYGSYGASSSAVKRSKTVPALRRSTNIRNVGVLSAGTRGVKKGRRQKGEALKLRELISRSILNMKEPKYNIFGITGQTVGQLNANASGHQTSALNGFMPVQGDGVSQRDGNQIIARYFKFGITLWGMNDCTTKNVVKFYLVKQLGVTPIFTIGQLFKDNEALDALNSVSVYDNTVMLNPSLSEDYVICGMHEVVLEPTPKGTQQGALQTNFYVDLKNQLVQFDSAAAAPVNCTFTLLATTNCGNKNLSTAGTMLGVPTNIVATGLYYNCNAKFGYRDV